jgi:hypothetical protein
MKLSSRKELLNEAELTLNSIKKSLNEDSPSESDVETLSQWMLGVIPIVFERKDEQRQWQSSIEEFIENYEQFQIGEPKDAKRYANDVDTIINFTMKMIISRLKDKINKLKTFQSELPQVQTIMKAISSDVKKIK